VLLYVQLKGLSSRTGFFQLQVMLHTLSRRAQKKDGGGFIVGCDCVDNNGKIK
jgi:hypothetical protein